MKFMHTSDWHLGKLLHGVSLVEDQAFILDQIIGLVETENVDVVIISGDIYDRSVPPHGAVSLLDTVLTRIVRDLGTPVIMIAGNHDSPDRLAFGSSIFRDKGLHIFGSLEDSITPAELKDEHGTVKVFGLPYAEPSLAREFLKNNDLHTHNQTMEALVGNLATVINPGDRTILVGHAFVAGSTSSESERPLSIGGAGTVASEHFKTFNYAALGHLHRCQTAGDDAIVYSGSILKYSFSEVDNTKSVSIVTMDDRGECNINQFELTPKRDMRSIKGFFDTILQEGSEDPYSGDYMRFILEDKQPIFEAMNRLREVYPNTLRVERESLTIDSDQQSAADVKNLSDLQMFQSFFKDLIGEEPTDEQTKLFSTVLDQLDIDGREATS
ncbi:MAG: exonuclease sbcCD subunit D [Gammaproteobacteria bacterium]|nr:MAG: exonuclease sbcCD subunit D [Gammaproteobacteria bacterium]